MSGLHDSILASKEEKKKRILELQAKNKAAQSTKKVEEVKKTEEIKKVEEIRTPRNSKIQEKSSIADIMQKVLSQPEPKLPAPSPPPDEPSKPVHKTILSSSGAISQVLIKGKPKKKMQEDEAQADLPKEPKKPKEKQEQISNNSKHQFYEAKEFEKIKEEEIENASERILRSNEISEFLEKSTRLVERALGQENPSLQIKAENELKHMMTLYSDEYSNERCISSLQWSPRYNELLLASYISVSRSVTSENRGLVCLWSLTLKSRPEYVLECQSSVTASTFNKFDHNLVISGTYSGQIVVWDLRTKSHPIQRTPLMAESHTHPVYCVSIIGSQHANNIVSASNDGKVCVWSLNMFNSPTSAFELKSIGCTCMAFPDNETNIFYVGAEDGSIFQTQLHGSRVVDSNAEIYESHFGPITGLDIHPVGENIFTDLTGNLLLSSSVDWSVKLWNPKTSKSPLLAFDIYEDYVFDVKWSPTHPSVFAVTEGTGVVDIWNLNKDVEMPVSRLLCPKEAVNKLDWGLDGDMLATGNCNGEIKIYKVPQEYYQPSPDDWSILENLISPN
jgi:dynein intermediate chain, cytosolic